MKASNIIGICHLGTIAAFAPVPSLQSRPSTSSLAYRPPHPHHPWNHPINFLRPLYKNHHQQRQNPFSPLSSSTVDAEVLTEAQELLNEQFYNNQFINNDSDGWNQRRSNSKDFRTTKEFRTAGADVGDSSSSGSTTTKRQSEVINFDPEQPIFKPLKSADENGDKDPFEEEYDDFMKFQRKQNAQRNHQHGEQQQQQQPPHHRHFPHGPPPPHPGMMPPPMGDFDLADFGNNFGDEAFFDMPPPPPHGRHPHMMPPMDMPPPPPPHFFGHDGPMDGGPMFMSENPMEEEENYVDRVDFADHGRPVNDRDNTGSVDTFFSDRPATNKSNNGQQGRRRGGPSVYTAEEEELIASMGGMGPPPPPPGRPSTQEFAEAGTQSAMRKYPQSGPMPPQFREEGYLGDSTLKEISMDYGIPITYLADVLATWGVPIPIDPNSRLGDMVTGEQAFAILEAIHTLDVAELHERYAEDDLMNLCDYYDLDIKLAFDFCMQRGWALPFGVRTFLRVEQEAELLDALDGGDGGMF
mmetsp:Transcript_12158/g.17489  ORF Transcript_12158/g.17489 Transcript_12158/m.17489 type:complete len:524 (+) Transcript_12158:196-1767(+)|eukprot:CAMPEP_0201697908 /NCGR_PEP_ID=MMETSP0578-20130828/15185_1 /ASSEMBLY_ACC=CAM_ASM_000663 /TAXON_ID=267565 /ORGANISM="Skeletonema grethea, Strain CCMP 1804" /LENGTH=523 /DNA_ID=CAMNT_0048184267 /DNA_START=193 /DNA_END=1764 /DNA_ORIENTATION=-